ncbi:hypothetical protein H6G54_01260 [Anabaena cylindrica FACHB-243]|uniref:hypothetical protein n=1 Tax=Anabaena TaxID=1163 RepID=UPI0002E890E4|nr:MULTISPECIES: hypothetical protein [Anabaena]MBD2416362.1 hypothetical protein [Anabaena cylindrica FACHB-243]MBY5284474.1 hypothetical protein [Anabaena sp. CCAP 1446/1C]MBY5311718.1 hypothetical protein [Anabaena sp. CCAP 1446/1C]MCM2407258.1 hypothetical protein [Anabaena sp. CCAP 1446/1C]
MKIEFQCDRTSPNLSVESQFLVGWVVRVSVAEQWNETQHQSTIINCKNNCTSSTSASIIDELVN